MVLCSWGDSSAKKWRTSRLLSALLIAYATFHIPNFTASVTLALREAWSLGTGQVPLFRLPSPVPWVRPESHGSVVMKKPQTPIFRPRIFAPGNSLASTKPKRTKCTKHSENQMTDRQCFSTICSPPPPRNARWGVSPSDCRREAEPSTTRHMLTILSLYSGKLSGVSLMSSRRVSGIFVNGHVFFGSYDRGTSRTGV